MTHASQTTAADYALGLDVGGTKIAGGIVDLATGAVSNKRIAATGAARGAAAVLADSLAMIRDLLAVARDGGLPVAGAGIGVPELVDLEGNVTSHQTLAWDMLPVRARFAAIVPAVVESDVRAAALAEATYGAGRGYRQFVYVTVGTGISHTLVLDGVPFSGTRGNALGFASSPLTMTCPHCGGKLAPILEDEASGPALVRRYNRATGGDVARAEAVLHASANGNRGAAPIVAAAGTALGVGVGWLVNVLDPEAVIIGGGLGLAGGLYWDSFVAATRAHIWAENARSLPILPAGLHADAGIVGAAAAFRRSARPAV